MKKLLSLFALLIFGIGTLIVSNDGPAYAADHAKNDASMTEDSAQATIADAEAIFKDDYLGARAIGLAFGQKYLTALHIPNPPYTVGELKRFHRWDFVLEYELDSLGGLPLTIKRMRDLFFAQWSISITFDSTGIPRLSREYFYVAEIPHGHWKLVSKDVIDASLRQDYMGQTALLNEYSGDLGVTEVMSKIETPDEMSELIKNINSLTAHVSAIPSQQDTVVLQRVSRMLATTKTNVECRETAVQVFERMLLYYAQNHDPNIPASGRLFEKRYVWTRSLSSDGEFVGMGFFIGDNIAFERKFANTAGKFRAVTYAWSK